MSARLARWATALAVLAVATIAAIVSYSHIQTLALSHGYTLGTAGLLPFSVDGLIVASSLALANGARAWLARTGLVLGILATVTANIMFGARFGITGAVVNSWPAVSFIVSSEILVGILRARPATVPLDVVQDVTGDVPEDVPKIAVNAVPATVTIPRARDVVRTVAAERVPAAKAKSPEHVFRDEIAAGRLPSLRAVKDKCRCGTPRARVILAELADLVKTPQAA